MKIQDIQKYKVNENDAYTNTDRRHVENYKQLIKFFENAIDSSISNEGVNYSSLHRSCIQSIRFLDTLIQSYELNLEKIRYMNSIIDKIFEENKELGNEEKNQNPI